MKKYLFIILAAVVGGLAALTGAQILGLNQQTKYVQMQPAPATNFARFAEPTTTPADPAPSVGFAKAADKALPAVVHIKASKKAQGFAGRGQGMPGIDPDQLPEGFRDLFGLPGGPGGDGGEMPLQQGSGSGVIISADGYIATNNHVVEGAEDLQVVLNDQRTYDAKIIGVDPTTDIALIKIEEAGLPTISFGDSDKLRVGEWVVAVGNPFSLTSTVTAGIVSAKGRSIGIMGRSAGRTAIESFIQTDAVVNPGNSGGALVDIEGNLIGINTAISSPTGVFAGYSFAVPSAIVRKVVKDLREYGVVQRGLLGAAIVELNTELAKEFDIERDNGVYVSEVTAGSAAEEAGMQKGDVIVGVDGVVTLRNPELLEQLGRHRPGDVVQIEFERDGSLRTVSARLRNAAGNTDVVRPAAKPKKMTDLGAEFVELDAGTLRSLNIDGGVKIANIARGLIADQTKIRTGFVVTRVEGKKVTNLKELQRAIDGADKFISLEGIYPGDDSGVVRKYGIAK